MSDIATNSDPSTIVDVITSVWHNIYPFVSYIMANILMYRVTKKEDHPWLAVVEMNTMALCQFPTVLVAVVFFFPYLLRSLADSSCESAQWLAEHATGCTLAFIFVVGVVTCICIHRMFKQYKLRLDAATTAKHDDEMPLMKE